MVRLSRPVRAASAAPSGISVIFARTVNRSAVLAAIIDAWRSRTTSRSGLPHLFSPFCPSNSLRMHLIPVYPLRSCAGVFALAIYSIQNQSADLLTS
ncbi:hypothetical protein PspTeo4_36720 [Pseudomonas sp. Teo4]|nr:hypothetical protein [Pseudomonas sp. Teo4]